MQLSLILGAMALALVLTIAAHPGPAALAVAAMALGAGLLPTGRRMALAAVAFALVAASPALAQTAAPSWGVWGALGGIADQGASWLVGGALSAIGAVFYAVFRVALPAVIESRLRQTMLSGAHLLVLEAEEAAERAWTPERRRDLVGQVVAYAMDRMPWAGARLKLTQRAVTGMAVKMLDQVLAGRGALIPSPATTIAGLPLSLPGAVLGAVASTLAPSSSPSPACPSCGASDPERMSRGCAAEDCPQAPADPAAGLAAAAAGALAVPAMLLGGGLAPTG